MGNRKSTIYLRQPLAQAVREFFGVQASALEVVSQTFTMASLPDIQTALDDYEHEHLSIFEVFGYRGSFEGLQNSLSGLMEKRPWLIDVFVGVRLSTPERSMAPVDADEYKSCIDKGLFFINGPHGKILLHVHKTYTMQGTNLTLEAASPDSNSASRFLTEIRRRSIEKCCYRGKIISLCCGGERVEFHKFTPVAPEDIILPPETKDMLQRNTVRFFQNADVLLRSGRSLKRGILLHGKPGTGKTYTAKWLGQSLQGVTVVLITTEQLGMVKESCQLARMLAPSLVIMEDVDLIASERDDSRHPAYQVTLHQIMNEMDGIDSEAAVIFLLTTNRPDVLESAIASRPGRIDQAIEFPLPDEDCRQKLIDLYGRGLTLQLENPSEIVSKIKGASPAFIKEFVRKASMFAAEDNADAEQTITVTDRDFELALKELIFGGGSLTRNLLGFDPEDVTSVT